VKTVNLEYTNIPAYIPGIDYFLNKIKRDEPFQFMRMNHGFVDVFKLTYKNWYKLQPHLEQKRYNEIAGWISNIYKAEGLGLGNWHKYSDKQKALIKNLIEMVFEYENLPNSVHIGISMGVGLGTHWGIWNESHPVQEHRTKFARILTDVTKQTYYYAGIMKHYTIKGEWGRVFKLLNEKDFNVIFVGPDTFGGFGEIFKIKNFEFIQIPRVGAIDNVDEYITKIKEIDSSSDKPTMLFTQCGHIISAGITKEIMDTDIYSFDIGRSFDILMKERFKDGDTAFKCWTSLDMNGLNNYVDNLRR
jgi:hypothetical protein